MIVLMVGGQAFPKAIELRLELHTLEDVGRWVLSWGRCANVIEPPALRQRVAEEMRATLKQYG